MGKKNPEKNQGFNGIQTRDLHDTGGMLYQLSYDVTHWEPGQFIEFISSRAVNDMKFIWNNSYLYCGCRWKWRVIIAVWLLLSNCLNWKIYCDDHPSLSSTTAVQIWIISNKLHIISLHGNIWTHLIDLAPNVWLHSSVGRASHRYRGGHGFESRWSPYFFSGFILDRKSVV